MPNKKMMSVVGAVVAVALVAAGIAWIVREKEENHFLTLYGNVDVRQVVLGFRVGGRLTAMYPEEGDLVSPDTLLAKLDARIYEEQLTQAQERVNALEAQLASLKRKQERRSDLVDSGTVSQEEYESLDLEIRALEASLRQAVAASGEAAIRVEDTELYTLKEGVVLSRIQEPGAMVGVGEPVYTVTIPKPVWVRTFVAEPHLGRLKPGMAAQVVTDTPTNPVYEGQVGFISPVAEFTPKSVETTSLRTDLVYQVRIVVTQPDEGLRQGMPVTVKIPL